MPEPRDPDTEDKRNQADLPDEEEDNERDDRDDVEDVEVRSGYDLFDHDTNLADFDLDDLRDMEGPDA